MLKPLPVPERVAVQVHEEVLRLLTASVGKLSAHQLATYLQATLQHSRKSRKCADDALLAHICLFLKAHSSNLSTLSQPELWQVRNQQEGTHKQLRLQIL